MARDRGGKRPPKLPVREPVAWETPAEAATRASVGSAHHCGACGGETGVSDSRKFDDYIIRRRYCVDCGERFSTYEMRLDVRQG